MFVGGVLEFECMLIVGVGGVEFVVLCEYISLSDEGCGMMVGFG